MMNNIFVLACCINLTETCTCSYFCQVNIRYSLDGTPLAERFFYIDPITGVIRLRADLRLDTFNTTTYNVSCLPRIILARNMNLQLPQRLWP